MTNWNLIDPRPKTLTAAITHRLTNLSSDSSSPCADSKESLICWRRTQERQNLKIWAKVWLIANNAIIDQIKYKMEITCRQVSPNLLTFTAENISKCHATTYINQNIFANIFQLW